MKTFDVKPHECLIRDLEKDMPTKVFEARCEPIVLAILKSLEGFESVEKGPSSTGTPFDFFGFRADIPYIVEFKGSRHHFNLPGETQRHRMRQLLEAVDGLHIALLQVKICDGVYRMLYDDEVIRLFSGRKAPMEPITGWIRQRFPFDGAEPRWRNHDV
jgi:hypothetical protein